MSLSKQKKNFYRICTLITDHAADAMRCLLRQFIQTKYRISFKDFVKKHHHEIYHKFNITPCCQCTASCRLPCKQVLSSVQMEMLFEKSAPKLSCHRENSQYEFCCSKVKQNLLIDDLDITVLKFFLVTYFEEEFWQNCLTGGVLFHDFLNQNQHDIYHLVHHKMPCCLCIKNPEYTLRVPSGNAKLTSVQWKTMFNTDYQHCLHNNPCGDKTSPCSVSATEGILPSNLDHRARIIILSEFCIMMKHIDQIVNARNSIYAHAIKGQISDEHFQKYWTEIEGSIMYLSKITSTDFERERCISNLREKCIEESMYLELQSSVQRRMEMDSNIVQECRKLQKRITALDVNVTVGFQNVLSKLTCLTTYKTNKSQKELSKKSLCYERVIMLVCCGGMLLWAFAIISIIFVGSKYLHDCPAEKNLPIFLIVSGSVVILAIVVTPYKEKTDNDNPLVRVIFVFMFAWWIAGNIWTYRTYGNFSKADATKPDYCKPVVFDTAFYMMAALNILCVSCIIHFVFVTCFKDKCTGTTKEKSDQDSFDQDKSNQFYDTSDQSEQLIETV